MLALIGTAAGVVSAVGGVVFGFLQWRAHRSERRDREFAAVIEDSGLFAPTARALGRDAGLIDRDAELATLTRYVGEGRSLLVIEGVAGQGKTALAARLCRQVQRERQLRWVFCEEKAAACTLVAVAKALAAVVGPRAGRRLRAALTGRIDTARLIDAVIDLLDVTPMLLVLDDVHLVSDPNLATLMKRLEYSRTASLIVATSRVRVDDAHSAPLAECLVLYGLAEQDTSALLRERNVQVSPEAARLVWQRAAGNPLALKLFAGAAADADPERLARELPNSVGNFDGWIALSFDGLPADDQAVAKIIAFEYEPVSRDVVGTIAAPLDPAPALADLRRRLLVTVNDDSFEMHGAVRDYIMRTMTDAEQAALAARFTDFYRRQARTLFLEGVGQDEPSYGKLYLESFPDYVAATQQHIRFVADLLERLADNGYRLMRGEPILVLGCGDGTHDPAFAAHGFDVTNVEIQPEIAELGRAKAAALDVRIRYVVADMTKPLPAEITNKSMSAVFNIGSSFGYESIDAANAAVFLNAANALHDDAPFVFEYVNGPHWENKRVQRQVDVTPLPNGSTRTEVSIINPEARTTMTLIRLQRPDGTGGWFRHFMRYYRLNEIVAMMAQAGLRPVAVYGANGGRVSGEPFDERRSEAMVIIAAQTRQ